MGATTATNPATNITLCKAVRQAFCELSRLIVVELHWIRGHSRIGGNERVDRISKAYANIDNNSARHKFNGKLSAHITQTDWPFGCDLAGLPANTFLMCLPTPPPFLSPIMATGPMFRDVELVSARKTGVAIAGFPPVRQPTQVFFGGSSVDDTKHCSTSSDSDNELCSASAARAPLVPRKRARSLAFDGLSPPVRRSSRIAALHSTDTTTTGLVDFGHSF